MKILIACEYSGKIREAYRKQGYDAYSCDIIDSDDNSPFHIKGDVRTILNEGWDLMVAHPPCTFLCSSAPGWYYHPADKHLPKEQRRPHPNYPNRRQDQLDALDFVRLLMNANIDRIAIENPIGVISTQIRKPDQIIQPWMFGHPETKATCFWLKNLPKLIPTNVITTRSSRLTNTPPGPDRWKIRSETFQGVADAIATQWI